MFSSPKTTPAPETAPGRACVGACVLRATCSDRRPCAHGGGIGDRRVGKRADNRPDAERNIGCNTRCRQLTHPAEHARDAILARY